MCGLSDGLRELENICKVCARYLFNEIAKYNCLNEKECELSGLSDGRRELANIAKIGARYLLNEMSEYDS